MRRYSKDKLKIQNSENIIIDSEFMNSNLPTSEIDERQLMLRLEKLAALEGLRYDRTKIKIPLSIRNLIDSKANESEIFKRDGTTVLEGPFLFKVQNIEPKDPDEGKAVMWMSDGTGFGDKGDIIIKVTVDGVTKTAIIIDYSQI